MEAQQTLGEGTNCSVLSVGWVLEQSSSPVSLSVPTGDTREFTPAPPSESLLQARPTTITEGRTHSEGRVAEHHTSPLGIIAGRPETASSPKPAPGPGACTHYPAQQPALEHPSPYSRHARRSAACGTKGPTGLCTLPEESSHLTPEGLGAGWGVKQLRGPAAAQAQVAQTPQPLLPACIEHLA